DSRRLEMAKQDISQENRGVHSAMLEVYRGWSATRGKSFKYWYESELDGWKQTILNSYFSHLRRMNEFFFGNPNSLSQLSILPNDFCLACDSVIKSMNKRYVDKDQANEKVMEFLSGNSLEPVPFIRLYCALLAVVAHRLSCGNK